MATTGHASIQCNKHWSTGGVWFVAHGLCMLDAFSDSAATYANRRPLGLSNFSFSFRFTFTFTTVRLQVRVSPLSFLLALAQRYAATVLHWPYCVCLLFFLMYAVLQQFGRAVN